MINGFFEHTQPLTEYEKEVLLPVIVKGLSTKVGFEKRITNKKICETLTAKNYKISEVRVRKIINHIRTQKLLRYLVASERGYYIATTIDELKEYKQSMQQRISAQQQVLQSIDDDIHYALQTQQQGLFNH